MTLVFSNRARNLICADLTNLLHTTHRRQVLLPAQYCQNTRESILSIPTIIPITYDSMDDLPDLISTNTLAVIIVHIFSYHPQLITIAHRIRRENPAVFILEDRVHLKPYRHLLKPPESTLTYFNIRKHSWIPLPIAFRVSHNISYLELMIFNLILLTVMLPLRLLPLTLDFLIVIFASRLYPSCIFRLSEYGLVLTSKMPFASPTRPLLCYFFPWSDVQTSPPTFLLAGQSVVLRLRFLSSLISKRQ